MDNICGWFRCFDVIAKAGGRDACRTARMNRRIRTVGGLSRNTVVLYRLNRPGNALVRYTWHSTCVPRLAPATMPSPLPPPSVTPYITTLPYGPVHCGWTLPRACIVIPSAYRPPAHFFPSTHSPAGRTFCCSSLTTYHCMVRERLHTVDTARYRRTTNYTAATLYVANGVLCRVVTAGTIRFVYNICG